MGICPAELHCLIGLLPFARSNLSLEFGRFVYCVDAGPKQNGICCTSSPKEEQRMLAGLAERGGWLLPTEQLGHAMADTAWLDAFTGF